MPLFNDRNTLFTLSPSKPATLNFPKHITYCAAIILVISSSLAGCNTVDNDAVRLPAQKETASQNTKVVTPLPVVPPAPTPTPAQTKLSTGNHQDGVHLALTGSGLQIVSAPSGNTKSIDFGMPQVDAIKILTGVQTAPPIQQGSNLDCGATYANWKDGLTTWFSRGKFAGWSVNKSKVVLVTVGGIGLGSTRADLDATYSTNVNATSLGLEFNTGGLSGILDSKKQNARITNLWAGVACLGR